jgi:opacity protein-like surface antigen
MSILRFLLLSLGLIASCAYAQPYLGIDLGIAHTQSQYNFKDNIVITEPLQSHIIDYSKPDIGDNGRTAGVFLGFDKQFESKQGTSYLLGIEIQLHNTPTDIKNTGSSTTYNGQSSDSPLINQDIDSVTLKNNYDSTAFLKFGIAPLKQTELFALFGIDVSRFQGKITAGGETMKDDGSYYIADPYVHRFSKRQVGWTTGIGATLELGENFSARLLYTYSNLGALKNQDSTPVYFDNNGVINQMTLTHTYQFKSITRGMATLGLIYNFQG